MRGVRNDAHADARDRLRADLPRRAMEARAIGREVEHPALRFEPSAVLFDRDIDVLDARITALFDLDHDATDALGDSEVECHALLSRQRRDPAAPSGTGL